MGKAQYFLAIPVWLCLFVSLGWAEDYPSHAINLIVPYAPGGVVDLTARIVGDGVSQKVGQPVVVVNRPGANGLLGAHELMKATPDGYTFMVNSDGGIVTPPAVDPTFKLDAINEIDPVAIVAKYTYVFLVKADFPANSIAEFVAYAKAHPGALNYGTPGIGTNPHLMTEMFAQKTGIKMTHVPYKGSLAPLNDLMGGNLSMTLQAVPTIMGFFGNKSLKVLGVFSSHRLSEIPDVPTLVELGFPDFVIDSWVGFFAPNGLNDTVKKTAETTLLDTVKAPDVQAKLRAIGFESAPADAATFRKTIAADTVRWKKVAADNGVLVAQ
jgi:tripartite-type tricarboxylate transporter receptor subunit TctC